MQVGGGGKECLRCMTPSRYPVGGRVGGWGEGVRDTPLMVADTNNKSRTVC